MALGVTIHARRGKKDFSQLAHNTHRVLGYKVRAALLRVRTLAYELAPVETGALREGIVIVGGPGYAGIEDLQDISKLVQDLRPEAEIVIPEVDMGMLDDLHGMIIVLAHYGIFQEYGTSRNPAHPFLGPAIMEAAPEFKRSMMGVFSQYELTGETVQTTEMFQYMQAGLDITDLG